MQSFNPNDNCHFGIGSGYLSTEGQSTVIVRSSTSKSSQCAAQVHEMIGVRRSDIQVAIFRSNNKNKKPWHQASSAHLKPPFKYHVSIAYVFPLRIVLSRMHPWKNAWYHFPLRDLFVLVLCVHCVCMCSCLLLRRIVHTSHENISAPISFLWPCDPYIVAYFFCVCI